MRIEFDDGTLLLHDAPEDVPYAEWDDRVDEYRAQAFRYRAILRWAGAWDAEQTTLQQGFDQEVEDSARAYPDLYLEPALQHNRDRYLTIRAGNVLELFTDRAPRCIVT